MGAGSHDLMMMKPIAFAICIIMYPIETMMRMMIAMKKKPTAFVTYVSIVIHISQRVYRMAPKIANSDSKNTKTKN